MDVDGVLTDGGFWWGADGGEWKRFSFRDVMGISRASRSGVTFALISGEATPQVQRFAEKMKIENVWQGCRDKGQALTEFAGRLGLPLSTIAFIGDDINDVGAMQLAGFAAAPADAHRSAREAAALVTASKGGEGVVREVLDHLELTS